MNGIAFTVRYPKRIMLVAAGAITQNAAVYRCSVCGVSCFSAFIKANTDKIVIGQALKNIAFYNAVRVGITAALPIRVSTASTKEYSFTFMR